MSSMSLRLRQRCELRQRLEQIQMLYETSGDLELLSLHRIKNRISSLDVHSEVKQRLVALLIKENLEYKKSSGNDWNCITPQSLDTAVYYTVDFLRKTLDIGISKIDNINIRTATKKVIRTEIGVQERKMKQWFYDNYDNLLYIMDGKIPYPIVLQMREELGKWVLGNVNPFSEPIESLIERTAKSAGLDADSYESYEDMWEDLKQIRV